jgi:hypothetical protein
MKNILCLEGKEARSHRIFSSEWQERKKERKKENSVKILTNRIS